MKGNRRLHLAAYDIADPGRLREALKLVRAHACGGQKSAYECFLSSDERQALLRDMAALLDPVADRFMLLPLGAVDGIRVLGIAVRPSDPDYYYVG
ncbi:MAG TPA: CRISPR-associated endonuclease Cas2 [Candidatus Competibacteraceae bacterium]|nr:CRISPR-associated endonuclease Cas2 [Candidatus Competibacteraceae bacterium]